MPVLPTFSAYHDALIAKLDELKTSIDAISGPDSRTLTDIYNKLDTTDTALQDIVLALRGSTAPTDNILWALRGISAGKEASDTRNVIDAAPTISGDVMVDMTTVETLLTALLSDTADPTYVQLIDLYQKLSTLEESLATLISSSIESGFTNLESLRSILAASDTKLTSIEADASEITPAIKDLESSLLSIDYCCTDGIEPITDEPPDDTTPAPANSCQRAQWLVEQLRKVLYTISTFTNNPNACSIILLEKLFKLYVGVTPPYTELRRFYTVCRTELLAGEFTRDDGIYDYYTDIMLWDTALQGARGLTCALAGATSPQDARTRWNYAVLDAAPTLRPAGIQVIQFLVWNAMLADLFDGTIPTDPTELDAYSSTACDDCGTSGTSGGALRLVVPTVGLPGGGVYEYSGGSWTLRNNGLPAVTLYGLAVAANPNNPDEWLAIFTTSTGGTGGSVETNGSGNLVGNDGNTGILWRWDGTTWSNIPISLTVGSGSAVQPFIGWESGVWAILVSRSYGSWAIQGSGTSVTTIAHNANPRARSVTVAADGAAVVGSDANSISGGDNDNVYYSSGSSLLLAGSAINADRDFNYIAAYPTGTRILLCSYDGGFRAGWIYGAPDFRAAQPTVLINTTTAWSVQISADERVYAAGATGRTTTGILEISDVFGTPSVSVVAASGLSVGRIGIDRQTRTLVAALNSAKTAVYLWDGSGSEETIIDASSLTAADLADFVEVLVDS